MRRNIIFYPVLRKREVAEAELNEGGLQIRFKENEA